MTITKIIIGVIILLAIIGIVSLLAPNYIKSKRVEYVEVPTEQGIVGCWLEDSTVLCPHVILSARHN